MQENAFFLSAGEDEARKKHSIEKPEKRLREGLGIFKKRAQRKPSEDSRWESAVSRCSWCGLRPLRLFLRSRREGRRHWWGLLTSRWTDDVILQYFLGWRQEGWASQPGRNRHLGPHNPLCSVEALRAFLASTQAHLLSVNLCQKWRQPVSLSTLSLYKGPNRLPLATSFNR